MTEVLTVLDRIEVERWEEGQSQTVELAPSGLQRVPTAPRESSAECRGSLSRPEEQVIQVGVQTLSWPLICACCNAPLLATNQETPDARPNSLSSSIPATRVRIAKWRQAPYCTECGIHVSQAQEADNLSQHGINALSFVAMYSPFIGLLTLCLAWLVSGSGDIGFWLSIAAIAGALIYAFWQKNQKDTQAHEQRMQAVEKMHDACCSVGPSVEYLGAFGSSHTFLFRNLSYAEEFANYNAENII